MTRWSARFVEQAPISGTVEECTFESEAAESAAWQWVRFHDSDGAEWFGAFRQGRVSRWRGVASPDERHFFIITGGALYCIDAVEHTLVGTLSGCSFQDVLPIPGGDKVAVADLTEVGILSPHGLVWKTPRLAWDGIRLSSASEREVRGIAETGHGPAEDVAFTVNLRSRDVVGGHMKDFDQWWPK